MKQFFIFALSISLLWSCGSVVENETPIAELFFSSDEIIPANMAIDNDGNLYFSVNPLLDPQVKFYQVTEGNAPMPYPSEEYVVGDNSYLEGVLGVRIDDNGNLWMLDLVDPKFVVWNITQNQAVDTIAIPKEVLQPNSFLQDFVIDESGDRVVIADMTIANDSLSSSPAFVVYDMESETFARIGENHPSLMAEIEGGYDLNPIAIDNEDKWIYFGALNGRKLFRAPAASFVSDSIFVNDIEFFSSKPYSDGIIVADNGTIYITNVEDNALAVSEDGGYMNIALLPDRQIWPDGLFIGDDGYLYSTVSQLSNSAIMNNGTDKTITPFTIVRTQIEE